MYCKSTTGGWEFRSVGWRTATLERTRQIVRRSSCTAHIQAGERMELFPSEEMITSGGDESPDRILKTPKTLTVLALLVGAAFIFSWLASYAVTDALVAAGVMGGWGHGEDPR